MRPAAPLPAVWRKRMIAAASAPYRDAGRFAFHFARGKLRGDPVFPALLQPGLLPMRARLLDLGCGQGLLAAWLRAAARLHAAAAWPAQQPAPPTVRSYRGIELMQADVARARDALGPDCGVSQGDIRAADFGRHDAVVILDVLHYLDYAQQEAVLRRARAALAPGGVLLLRIGDAASGIAFRYSTWVDRVVTRLRGHRGAQLYCRDRSSWIAQLHGLGFDVQALPMSRGTGFANVLLVARLPAADAMPASTPAANPPPCQPRQA